MQDMIFAFEPGDLISQTMSLGAPRRSKWSSAVATWPTRVFTWTSLREQFDRIASLRDTQIQQSLHYPTVQVTLDRERAGLSGVTARDIGQSLIAATYSSRYTARNFWRDDVSGNSYQVQVEVPQPRMTEATRRRARAADHPGQPPAGGTGRRFPVQPDASALDT